MEIQQAIETASKFVYKGRTAEVSYGLETIQIEGGKVVGHNLISGVIVSIDDKNLSAAVDAKKLVRTMKACGKNPRLDVNDRFVHIRGDGGGFKLPVHEIKDIPRIKEPPKDARWITVESEDYAAIKGVMWSVSDDSTRQHMTGVYFADDWVQAISGHCLSRCRLSEGIMERLGSKTPISVLPEALVGLAGEVEMCIYEKKCFARVNDEIRVTQVQDVAMPSAESIMKAIDNMAPITTSRTDLLETVKRALVVGNAGVLISVKGNKMIVSCDDNDSKFSFTHAIDIEKTDGDMKDGCVLVSGNYIQSALEEVENDVVEIRVDWDPSGSLNPVFVFGKRYQSVIMPMRI